MEAIQCAERYVARFINELSSSSSASISTLDAAVANVAPWLDPQHRHYLVGGIAVFTALVGAITVLFVWIASRQVRPRNLPPPSKHPQLPTSPTSKRQRRSKSFTDLLALERDRMEENALLDKQDRIVFPLRLRQKCRPDDLKLIYDTLSKVFSFLKGDFVEPLTRDLEILKFTKGQEIFAKGAHDGSIMLVASGEVSLTIHGDKDDQRFKKIVRRGDSLMSSLSLLAVLINDAPNGECSKQSEKICGSLSAAADKDSTTIFRIPAQTIQRVTQAYPDSFFRLAQAAFSQVEKITAKSLMYHFGLFTKIVTTTPLVHPLLMNENMSSDTKRECVESVAESIGLEILPRFLLPMEKYEWISSFHNVQFPFEAHQPDFLRLCRRITGNAVGVVLGGGGARGLAHIGVLRALEECGIHVDVVGGTSIGAFIGAIYALHPHDLALVESKVLALSLSMSSIMEKLKDLTLPISSFFNGSRFNRTIREFFYDLSIEDLMLNYFCVSTDIAKSRMSVHHSGHVWKYVRASMSLQGYLPPISEDGSLLLDGGYMNNLPADVMKEEGGIKYIVAVDVGSEPRRGYFSYGSSLSGWWLLWNKINPFAKTVIVPSMGDVSAALAYVSSEQHKDRMKAECIDLYLRPPVNDYGTLQFDKMEEIIRVGYEYALPRIQAWAAQVLTSEPDADIVEPSAKTPKRDGKRSP
uniref:PNPLA domain-containing protein n=1 Tax=Globisporangium ultimum (strain ATCC 200006 / CBS 805.95 / DAOM BR144) TaxID=431595 RepID=K3WH12_GLOUD